MGQRLVVDIIEDDKVIAAIYYHWSAYFSSTIDELAKLSKAILKADKEGKDKLLEIIETLEEDTVKENYINGTKEIVHGGMNLDELNAAQKLYPNHHFKTEHTHRSYGLIAITEQGINNFHDWEEGHADIDLDTYRIYNNVDLDSYPFEFIDAVYEEDEFGETYISELKSGRIKINDRTYNVDPFNCTCEEIIRLEEFMEKENKIWCEKNGR